MNIHTLIKHLRNFLHHQRLKRVLKRQPYTARRQPLNRRKLNKQLARPRLQEWKKGYLTVNCSGCEYESFEVLKGLGEEYDAAVTMFDKEHGQYFHNCDGKLNVELH